MALKPKITRQLLKDNIGCHNIFTHYFGEFEIGKSYNSVFRQDDKPSTGFYVNANGSIIYNDLTTSKKYDFVQFVMELFKLNYYKAMERIAIDFGLIKGSKTPVAIKPIHQPKAKELSVFTVTTRPFNKKDIAFWKTFGINKQELIANNIFSVEQVIIKDLVIETAYNELKFAYIFKDDEGKCYTKIYSPESEVWKWSGNVPLKLVYGMERLTCTGDRLIITKSVKDYLVLKKFFPEVIALQNESPASLTKKDIKALKKCYSEIILWFDMDRPGIKAANYYKKEHGFKTYFIGSTKRTIWQNLSVIKRDGIKDPADFVRRYGLKTFELYLKHLNLVD